MPSSVHATDAQGSRTMRKVDESEIKREGPTYTVETLRELRERLSPDDELFFIVGEDALADLPAWRDPAGIAALALIAVAPRQGVQAPALPFDARSRVGRTTRSIVPGARVDSIDTRAPRFK